MNSRLLLALVVAVALVVVYVMQTSLVEDAEPAAPSTEAVASLPAPLERRAAEPSTGREQVASSELDGGGPEIPAAPAIDPFFGVFEVVEEPADGVAVVVLHADTGAPLAGALVRAVAMGASAGKSLEARGRLGVPLVELLAAVSRAMRTDANGRVRVPADPSATLLFVQAEDAAGPMEFFGALLPGLPLPYEARLGRVRAVEVQVVDTAEAPVRGARVFSQVRHWRGGRERVQRLESGRTDAAGRVRFWVHSDAGVATYGEDMVAGELSVALDVIGPREDGAVPIEVQPEWPGQGGSGLGVARLVMPATGGLAVRVVDARGRTWAGGLLTVMASGSPQVLFEHRFGDGDWEGEASEAGFLLPPVALGLDLELRLEPARRLPRLVEQVAGPALPGEVVAVTFALDRSVPRVRGRALDGDGAPLAAQSLGFGERFGAEVVTDAEGRFEFDAAWLSESSTVVRTKLDGREEVLSVDLPDAAGSGIPWIEMGDIVFARAPLLVSGRLVDRDGEPLVGKVSVIVYDGSPEQGGRYVEQQLSTSVTDGAGNFVIDASWRHTTGGDWLAIYGFAPNGQSTEPTLVPLGSTEVEVVLGVASSLRFRLERCPKDVRLGLDVNLEPLADPSAQMPETPERYPVSSPVGRENFLSGLLPGRYSMTITAGTDWEGLEVTWTRELDIVAGINNLGDLDEALDLHVYVVEFDPLPAQPAGMPRNVSLRTPVDDGALWLCGGGVQTGPATWTLISIGPATEIRFYDGRVQRTWPIEGPQTRVPL